VADSLPGLIAIQIQLIDRERKIRCRRRLKMAEILTLPELAKYLKTSRDTIYRKAQKGIIPAVKFGKEWRFPKDVIDEWLRKEAKSRIETADDFSERVGKVWAQVRKELKQAGFGKKDVTRLIAETREKYPKK
jgi:excisionase family DNA binding protein